MNNERGDIFTPPSEKSTPVSKGSFKPKPVVGQFPLSWLHKPISAKFQYAKPQIQFEEEKRTTSIFEHKEKFQSTNEKIYYDSSPTILNIMKTETKSFTIEEEKQTFTPIPDLNASNIKNLETPFQDSYSTEETDQQQESSSTFESDQTLTSTMPIESEYEEPVVRPNPCFEDKKYILPDRHHAKLGEHAVKLWVGSNMTDIIIRVQKQQFQAHKAVLTCYCPYFKKKLLGPGLDYVYGVDLQNIDSEAFEVLLTYMYTGRLRLTCHNLGDVYRASRLLEIKEITHICSQILAGQIGGVVSTLYLFVTAKQLGIAHASQRAFDVIINRLEEVLEATEFLQLDISLLCEILESNVIGCRSEVILFLAALKWLNFSFFERELFVLTIMKRIRFSLMKLEEILACFHPPILPGIIEDRGLQDYLLRSVCFVAAQTIGGDLNFRKYQSVPRQYLVRKENILWDSKLYNPFYFSSEEQKKAAQTLQHFWRRYSQRKHIVTEKTTRNIAAIKIQSLYRGYIGRKRFREQRTSSYPNFEKEGFDPCLYQLIHQNQTRSQTTEYTTSESIPSSDEFYLQSKDSPVILALGGFDPSKIDNAYSGNAIWRLSPNWNAWKHCAQLPLPRHNHQAAIHTNCIFIIGGCDPKESLSKDLVPLATCFSFNMSNNCWTQLDNMANSRIYHGLCCTETAILVVGGKNEKGEMLNSIECLMVGTLMWVELDIPLSKSRMGMGVAFFKGLLWVIGGLTEANSSERSLHILNSVECLDPRSNNWAVKSNLPEPLTFLSVLECNHQLYILGGITPAKSKALQYISTSNMCVFNNDTETWKCVNNLPSPRHGFAATKFGENYIYIVGGLSTYHTNILFDVHKYDIAMNQWTEIIPLPTAAVGTTIITLPPLGSCNDAIVQCEIALEKTTEKEESHQ